MLCFKGVHVHEPTRNNRTADAVEESWDTMFRGATAAGTLRDLQAGTDLAAEYPYFAAAEESERFISLTLRESRGRLPDDKVRYVDFGGGQGHLALAVKAYLEQTGRQVEAVVADGNTRYLMEALRAGLDVLPCNLEACHLTDFHLLSMRLVNHYNTRPAQLEILRRAHAGLCRNGMLLVQIETGPTENCRLRTDIANLLAQRRGELPGYYWATGDDFEQLLRSAGFEVDSRADAAWQFQTQVSRLLESSWLRFNNESDPISTANAREAFFSTAVKLLERRLARHGSEELGVTVTDSNYVMHSAHTVFVATRH